MMAGQRMESRIAGCMDSWTGGITLGDELLCTAAHERRLNVGNALRSLNCSLRLYNSECA